MNPKTSMIDLVNIGVDLDICTPEAEQQDPLKLYSLQVVVVPILKTSLVSLSPYSPPNICSDHPPSFYVCSPTPAISQLNRVSPILLGIHQDMPLEIKENLPQLLSKVAM